MNKEDIYIYKYNHEVRPSFGKKLEELICLLKRKTDCSAKEVFILSILLQKLFSRYLNDRGYDTDGLVALATKLEGDLIK